MMNQKPSFRFEIDKFFSEKNILIPSPIFVSGGLEWYLNIYPKGDKLVERDDHLSLYLNVANQKSLRSGWNRIVHYNFVLLNESDKDLYRPLRGQASTVFCAETPAWGWRYFLPLSKLQKSGLLENDKLIIEVYIDIVESFDGEGGDVSSKKDETVEIKGFQVFASQVTLVKKLFTEHPDIAKTLKPKNQVVKTIYMNVLLNIIETLNKPSENHSETELSNAHSELNELEEVGFKLEWLRIKLGMVYLKTKKADADEPWIQPLERVKNFELMDLGFKLFPSETKVEEVSLERKKSDDADHGSRVQQLEERLKKIEQMELDFKLDCLKSKLEEVSLEKMKADADWFRVPQLEENVKNLEIMVSDLKTELNKEKAKSCADGFFLVDELA